MATRFVPIVVQLNTRDPQAGVLQLRGAFRQLDDQLQHTGNGLQQAFVQADLTTRGLVALKDQIVQTFNEFRKFEGELANVNTLLSDNGQTVAGYRQQLLQLDPALGQASELTRGLYQALSSGVQAGQGLQFIETAAKAARAGLATTFEAVDAGTSVLNS